MTRAALERIGILTILIFLACVVRLWLVPLSSSFWVDELVTVFVVRHPGHSSFAVAPQVPESIYYWLPQWSSFIFGTSEAAYRAFSIPAMLAALFFIARLAARLIHPEAGWFAVFACLAIPGINYAAIDARPYGLGMAISAAGVWFLVRWLDSGAWRDALLFVVCSALLWRVHLIYWPFYFVFVIYAAVRFSKRDTRASVFQVLVATALSIGSLVPVALKALTILRGASSHVIAPLPDARTLENSLHWNLLLICGAGGWGAARFFRWPAQASEGSRTPVALIGAWWLCQPIALFLYSHFTGNSVFIPRYVSLLLPGAALAATGIAAQFVPSGRWRSAALALGVGALLVNGQWNTLWPRHDRSDWRSAALEVNRLSDPQMPVICPSPFIEARPPAWTPDYKLPGFLYSQLDYYRVQGRIYLFPFETPPEAERYAAELAEGDLLSARRFLIYGSASSVKFWRRWFGARPELAGWQGTLEEFGDVYVARFAANTLTGSLGAQPSKIRGHIRQASLHLLRESGRMFGNGRQDKSH